MGLAPQRSIAKLVQSGLGCRVVPLWQSHGPSFTTDDVVDDVVDDPVHGSQMGATLVATMGSVMRSLLGLASTRWGPVRKGTSSSASASMA
jgi:hypothetical protein